MSLAAAAAKSRGGGCRKDKSDRLGTYNSKGNKFLKCALNTSIALIVKIAH